MSDKIDSNVTGLSVAEESTVIGVLPGTPVWFPLEPNEYEDFGSEVKMVARNPISADRQQKKGVVVDFDAMGGFTQDLTQRNAQQLLQGFFFADAHEKPSTHAINGKPANTVTLSNLAAGNDLTVDDGTKFQVGHILKLSGMKVSANNVNEAVVDSIAVNVLTTTETFVVETVDSNSRLDTVGYEFAAGVCGITVVGTAITLTRSGGDFTTLGLSIGEWLFIGGDATINKFAGFDQFYAKIVSITSTNIVLESPTQTPITDAGAGKEIRIYFGTYFRNEETTGLIKRRSYQFERTLGQDANGVQSQYLVGAVPNEFVLNVPATDKITADLSFVGLDAENRDGTTGVKSGTRRSLPTEDAYNSSNDVYQLRLFVHDDAAITPTSLFARVMEATLTISNGAKGLKAIGTAGSFDINVGDFVVSGELEAYFSTVAAIEAVRANSDVAFNMISAQNNSGFVFDIPLLSLGGGLATVEKDEPVMLPLESSGAKNNKGYTLSMTFFSFVPTAGQA